MFSCETDKKISAWLNDHKEELLSDWMALIRIPSIQADPEEGAPYGKACAEALQYSADLFTRYGFETKINNPCGYALSRFGQGKKILGLFSHCDVVPAGDAWICTAPFEPKMIDGFLVGRGCNDNKSGVIASLYAMRAVRELMLPLSCTLQSFVGSCEETGMNDIKSFVNNEKMPHLSLVPDADFPCSLGEKGILRLWLECATPMESISDLFGGDAFNVILDKATAILPAREDIAVSLKKAVSASDGYILEERDHAPLLSSFGLAKHAAHPEGGINAAARLAELLLSVLPLPKADRTCLETIRDHLSSFDGKSLSIDHTDPHFGALTCVNGMIRMKDGKVQISLDIRYGPSLDGTELENKLSRAWEEKGWHILSVNNEPGFTTPKESRVPTIITELCKEMSGKEHQPYRMSGGTYARYLQNAFALGTALHGATDASSLLLPEGHGGVHQKDECINVDAFMRAVRLLIHAILECDKLI